MKEHLLELQKSIEDRKKYMNMISQDIRDLEFLLKESGLPDFDYKLFRWERCTHGSRRLFYYDGNKYLKLIESPFSVREKAHGEIKDFIEHIHEKIEVNFNI